MLLMDSAIKGTVLLALAAVVAWLLRRDSAATRHLVWMTSIVALLVVPVLSATLPQWRVLPNWMSSPRPTVVAIESVSPKTADSNTNAVVYSEPAAACCPSVAWAMNMKGSLRRPFKLNPFNILRVLIRFQTSRMQQLDFPPLALSDNHCTFEPDDGP